MQVQLYNNKKKCLSLVYLTIIFYIGLAGEKHIVAASVSALRDSIFRMDEEGEEKGETQEHV